MSERVQPRVSRSGAGRHPTWACAHLAEGHCGATPAIPAPDPGAHQTSEVADGTAGGFCHPGSQQTFLDASGSVSLARGDEAQTLPLALRELRTAGKGSKGLTQSGCLLGAIVPSCPVLSCPSVGCVWVVVGEGRVRRAVRGGRCVGREAWEGPHCSERAAVMSGERWRRAPVRVGLVPEGGGAGWLPAGSSSTGATLGGRVGGGVCGASLVGWSVRRGDVSPAWPLPTRERSTAVVRPPVSRHCLAPLGAADSVQEQMQEDVGTSGWGCRHRDFPTICMRRFSWWVFVILGHVSCTGLRIPWGSRWGHIPSPPPASGHHLSVVCCFGNGA